MNYYSTTTATAKAILEVVCDSTTTTASAKTILEVVCVVLN